MMVHTMVLTKPSPCHGLSSIEKGQSWVSSANSLTMSRKALSSVISDFTGIFSNARRASCNCCSRSNTSISLVSRSSSSRLILFPGGTQPDCPLLELLADAAAVDGAVVSTVPLAAAAGHALGPKLNLLRSREPD